MKVGDYVRTKDGFIGKYHIEKEYQTIPMWQDKSRTKFEKVEQEYINNKEYDKYEIIKSSQNIIDLIEVGDYVDGKEIIKICDDFAGRKILVYGYDDGERQVAITIYEEDIKSIVTKEQFKEMEYRIGDD